MAPVKTGKIQAGRFSKGKSGNPDGRPKGSRNKITLAIEALLDNEGEALTQKAIELAKEGDMQALRLRLDRVVPPRKDRSVNFELPPSLAPARPPKRPRHWWQPSRLAKLPRRKQWSLVDCWKAT
jgi:hypothetical protein